MLRYLIKTTSSLAQLATFACAVYWNGYLVTAADGPLRLGWHKSSEGLELSWSGTTRLDDGSTVRPYFELQRSSDFRLWQPCGERMHTMDSASDQALKLTLGFDQPNSYYRLLAVPAPKLPTPVADGADVFGYGDAFTNALQRIGQISPEQFAAMFPTGGAYLSALIWDPTTAQFWNSFNLDPEVVNVGKQPQDPGYRSFDSRLNPVELALFQKNGFVVSQRLGAASFAEVFYNLWHNDLPVFISCDALLQAWHRTYDAVLAETEETYLYTLLQTMLDGMAGAFQDVASEVGHGFLMDSLLDADYFMTVARSLLAGEPIASALGQDARVAITLTSIQSEQLTLVEDFFGTCRMVDFSQFKVRGHYVETERLRRYFKCVMWLGRIDLAIAGGPFDRGCGPQLASLRECGTAVLLWHLLNRSGQVEAWSRQERLAEAFVGPTDSMTFGQLGGLLAGAGLLNLSDVRDRAALEQLQRSILAGDLGVQNVRSDWFQQPLGSTGQYALPRSFTVLGQKFVPDSWALSQTVYDSVAVQRRVPGALDVAFAVLANDQLVPELVAQIHGTFPNADRAHASVFRDGLPYQPNLAAVRLVIDSQSPSSWDSNLYVAWLAVLRSLSLPTTDSQFPVAMRTRAWAIKTLNTQLASWTQLRHDNILLVKQSYALDPNCLYPKGYVEPRLEFWNRLEQMVHKAVEVVGASDYTGSYSYVGYWPLALDVQPGQETPPQIYGTNDMPVAFIQSRQLNHLRHFETILARLAQLTQKELAGACFSAEDLTFIDSLMEERRPGVGCVGPPTYTGWYPQLFYRAIYWDGDNFQLNHGAGAKDTLVADVHTDVAAPLLLDPGSVLHEAVGPPNFLLIAVDHGRDRSIYAGPVFSHYEFEVLGNPRRLSDEEWDGVCCNGLGIPNGVFPPDVPASRIEGLSPPVWTREFLVPAVR